MIKETLERRIDWASNPAEDAQWCRDYGYRAYALMPSPGSWGCLLLTRGSQVLGVAEVGDTLVFDGEQIVIRVAGD
jgi:hypothetical protein